MQTIKRMYKLHREFAQLVMSHDDLKELYHKTWKKTVTIFTWIDQK